MWPDTPRAPWLTISVVIVLAFLARPTIAGPGSPAQALPICLSAGEAHRQDGRLLIEAPITRAVVPNADGDRGGVEVELLGLTPKQVPAASGRVLQQVGLRLRMQDACNGIYVMWPLGDSPRIRVMVKHNEGQSRFAECGARGYKIMRPETASDIAPLTVGQPRRLEAALRDDELTVMVDGRIGWKGHVSTDATRLPGYAGFRTDNARVRLSWIGPLPSGSASDNANAARPPLDCSRRR